MSTAVALFGYARVSTDLQEAEGVSLDAQRAALQAYAASMGAELREIFFDVASAHSLDRAQLRACLLAAQHFTGGPRAVCVVKLDRLTRSVRDLGELLQGQLGPRTGVDLVSVRDSIDTRTAAGRLVLNVLVSVAQWEREAVGERTREALAHLQASGVYLGRAPYGWRAEPDSKGRRVLVREPTEQVALDMILALASLGHAPHRIAAELNEREIPTRTGRPWAPRVVRAALRRTLTQAQKEARPDPARGGARGGRDDADELGNPPNQLAVRS